MMKSFFSLLIFSLNAFISNITNTFLKRHVKMFEQMVRPTGVEPAAFGVGVRRSIQLGYGRVQKQYNIIKNICKNILQNRG